MFLKRHCLSILQDLPKQRIVAVDALRGIAITAMILVNNPGSWKHVYPPLLHAKWHGWTPTDLIFPLFLFIVGVSIHLSVSNRQSMNLGAAKILLSAALRMLKLIGLGLFLAIFYYNFLVPEYDWVNERLVNIRLPGVLQRIGIVYFITLVIVLYSTTLSRVLWCAGLLIGYWALFLIVPYSDSAGNTFAGLMEHGNSVVAWFDDLIIGKNHLYYGHAHPFAFDPEGILSTVPSVVTCLTGVLAGQYLTSAKSITNKALVLLVIGVAGIVVGQWWSDIFPINKSLWTSSYVLLTSGYACAMLAICLWVMEGWHWRNWAAPFIVFGANSIAFFMLAGIAARVLLMIPAGNHHLRGWLFESVYAPMFGNLNGSLAYAITFLLFSYLLMFAMYQRKWFWRV